MEIDKPSLKIDSVVAEKYLASRDIRSEKICHAPFTNIYFNVIGQGAACWLTFFGAPSYPKSSLREIWFGQYYNDLRKRIDQREFLDGCRVCAKNMERGLYRQSLAQAYDIDTPIGKYPRIMEFELSNLCNLECVMCNGRLSSSIRKRRDQLPAIPSPYDDEFVRQLEEFIPHLESARFNGGEPLLQKECLQIWERIIAIKPSIEITIATNGTVWSPKIEKLLKKGRFKINLSLDGMSAKTYESIRRNSDFKKVVANAARFSEYCVEAGTVFCIMYNPMRTNWHEIPDLIRFCNENGYHVWFNTIYRPFQLALWTLPSKELYKIYEELSHRSMPLHEDHSIAFGNTQKYHTFVHVQLKNWAKEQEEREKKDEDYRSKQLAKKNSKSFFLKKLESSVAETGRLSKIMNKLDFVEKGVSKNIQASDFYQLLNERPVDWVVHDLEKRSAEEVIEELYYRAEYY